MPRPRAKKCAPPEPGAKKKVFKVPKVKPVFVDSLITAYEDYEKTSNSSSLRQTEISLFNPALEKKDSTCVYHETAPEWLWNLVCGQNLILYGIGSHKKMLSEFRSLCLDGEDVLEFSGNPSPAHHQESGENNWIKNMAQVLRTIANDILELKHFPIPDEDPVVLCLVAARLAEYLDVHYGRGNRGQDEQEGLVRRSRSRSLHNIQPALPQYKRGRYQHNQTRLFLVIHDLCGPALGPHSEGLTILAALTRGGRSVSFISSIASLSLPIHLSPVVLSSLDVQWIHAPSYASYHPVPKDHPLFGGRSASAAATTASSTVPDSSEHSGSNMASTTSVLPQGRIVPANTVYMVLKAFGQVTRDLMQLICTSIIPLQPNRRDISISHVIQKAADQLLIRRENYQELMSKLNELFEQKLLARTTSSARINPVTGQLEHDQGRIILLIPDREIVNLANGVNAALNDNNDDDDNDEAEQQTKSKKRSRENEEGEANDNSSSDQGRDSKVKTKSRVEIVTAPNGQPKKTKKSKGSGR